MKFFNTCSIIVIGIASVVFAHATVEVHRPLAEKAWESAGFTPDIPDVIAAKTELINGAQDEDNDANMWGDDNRFRCLKRSSLHGYNPLTGTTGGVFEHKWPDFRDPSIDPRDWINWPGEVPLRTAKQRAMDMWQDGVRDEAAYPNTQAAFENNALYGGDGNGGYHYLGRISHMLQDMTSPPHILWQSVWTSHYNYEDFWADYWPRWWTNIGSLVAGVALKPTDPLPQRATLWLDQYTIQRINDRWNQVKADTIDGFMDTLAWLAYFRVSIWGEIKNDSGEAAPVMTTPTDSVDAKPNTLRTMFGRDNIRYTLCSLGEGGFNYWTIFDQAGFLHYFEAEAEIDDWWPADGNFPDGHYEYDALFGQNRYTGRFYFSRPGKVDSGLGSGGGVWPKCWPDGTSATKSLAEYYGDCLFPLTIQYNAGLLNLAHPRVRVQTSPRLGLRVFVDGKPYTDGHTFRWPIKSPHTIAAEQFQRCRVDIKRYIFQRWSDDGSPSHTINPDSDTTITVFYSPQR